MPVFNLLVSFSSVNFWKAREEIEGILERLGDDRPLIEMTIARGILGVKTSLVPRQVVRRLRELFEEDPLTFQYTVKWVPIDAWASSDMDSMKRVVMELKGGIGKGEKWRMTVEKRRYTKLHSIEIIRELAELIDEKVDLENPDKILRIDIIGRYAGISILKPNNVFSVAKQFLVS